MTDMSQDIVEAVHLQYEDDPDYEAQCMLFLANCARHDIHINALEAEDRLREMGRCIYCGEKLQQCCHKEWHSEVNAYEDMYEMFCPNCDIVP